MTVKNWLKEWWWIFGFIGLALLGVTDFAEATERPPHNRPPDNRPPDNRPTDRPVEINHVQTTETLQNQTVTNEIGPSTSSATGGSVGPVAGGSVDIGSAGGAGGSVGDVAIQNSTNYRRQVPDTTLLINSNMDNCIRVLGFSAAKDSGSLMFGIPIPRDHSCDMWRAVNEAQENGHVLLSYAFMCEIKNIRKTWGLEKCGSIVGLATDWLTATTSLGVAPGK